MGVWGEIVSMYEVPDGVGSRRKSLLILGALLKTLLLFLRVAISWLVGYLGRGVSYIVEGRPNGITKLPSKMGIALSVALFATAALVVGPSTLQFVGGRTLPPESTITLLLTHAFILVAVAMTVCAVQIRVSFIKKCQGVVVAVETNSLHGSRGPYSVNISEERALRDQRVLFASGKFDLASRYATVVQAGGARPTHLVDRAPALFDE